MLADTIFALSSGSPPAGIAVVRISGPGAGAALVGLTGKALPQPRLAMLSILHDPDDALPLDTALTLWFPEPASATGEDVAELHLHGGRAVVAAVLTVLGRIDGLRHAEPGEFTRRAFEKGRIDLSEAEGLGDLLRAETEGQRRNAVAQAGGALGRLIDSWREHLTCIAAKVEAAIDFSDEDDVGEAPHVLTRKSLSRLVAEIESRLTDPPAERLHDGLRVAIIGPPNAGKSTLLNALVAREAAIVSPIAGTTRDVIEVPVVLRGLPLVFIDTAGLRDATEDSIEAIGIDRAMAQSRSADIVLALTDGAIDAPSAVIVRVRPKSDLRALSGEGFAVSALTGAGLTPLVDHIATTASALLPPPDRVGLNQRHRAALHDALAELHNAAEATDELVVAENIRSARVALARVTGGDDVESMLDALFGTFCIGK